MSALPQILSAAAIQHGIDKNAILMCHCDGANSGTTFTDVSIAGAHTITAAGAANTNNAQSKFGGSSCQCTTSGALSVTSAADLNFGTADFTVDMWVYQTNAQLGEIVEKRANSSTVSGFILQWSATVLTLLVSFDGATFAINGTFGAISLNTWTHLAIERHGNNFNGYNNGARTLIGTNAGTIHSNASPVTFGRDPDPTNAFLGYMDEIRISSIARYQSANFTPPAAPYTY